MAKLLLETSLSSLSWNRGIFSGRRDAIQRGKLLSDRAISVNLQNLILGS